MHRMPEIGDIIRGSFLPLNLPPEVDAALVVMVSKIESAVVVDYLPIDSGISVIEKQTLASDIESFAIDVADIMVGLPQVKLNTIELINKVSMRTTPDGKTHLV